MKTIHNGQSIGKIIKFSHSIHVGDEESIIVIDDYYNEEIFCKIINSIKGILTSSNNNNSHCIILAKAYDIPIVFLEKDEICKVKDGDIVFIEANDEFACLKILDNEENIKKYKLKCLEYKEKKNNEKMKFKDIKCTNPFGGSIEFYTNIIVPEEVDRVSELHADGIGVFRTEFIFLNKNKLPDEEEQFQCYKYVVEKMKGKKVIIRTIDIGGDKKINYLNIEKEDNPFLGVRGIRFCLYNKEIFKTQIKAILRASSYGNVCLLLPMITVVNEVIEAKKIINECKEELNTRGEKYGNIEVGIMVEVPAVAIGIDNFVNEIDYVSIGTNDLTQYIYAADRSNDKVSMIYEKSDNVIIKVIEDMVTYLHSKGIKCSVCGEMASDAKYIETFLRCKVDALSVSTSKLLDTKKQVYKLMNN